MLSRSQQQTVALFVSLFALLSLYFYIALRPDDTVSTAIYLPLDDVEADLGKSIEENRRISASVRRELRELEKEWTEKREDLRRLSEQKEKEEAQIADLKEKIKNLEADSSRRLQKLQLDVREAELTKRDLMQNQCTPVIRAPTPLKDLMNDNAPLPSPKSSCAKPDECFDYSRCSLVSGFPVYVYNTQEDLKSEKSARDILEENNFIVTSNPDRACVFLVINGGVHKSNLEELPHWNGDGRNHILWSMSGTDNSGGENRALVVQPAFTMSAFRPGFDIVAPFHHATEVHSRSVWSSTVELLPLRRKYLVTFEGKMVAKAPETSVIKQLNNIDSSKNSSSSKPYCLRETSISGQSCSM